MSRPQGSAFDIGAFELEQTAATATPTNTPVPTDTPTATPTNTPVVFAFSGFFQPVDNSPVVNTVNAGQGIPVKFSLGGNFGLNIFASGYPAVQQYSCGGGGGTSPIDQTVTAGNSSLQYDPATNQYTYVWKTDKAWSGTCRQLIVRLSDGTEHSALFQFNGKANAAGSDGQIFLPLINR